MLAEARKPVGGSGPWIGERVFSRRLPRPSCRRTFRR